MILTYIDENSEISNLSLTLTKEEIEHTIHTIFTLFEAHELCDYRHALSKMQEVCIYHRDVEFESDTELYVLMDRALHIMGIIEAAYIIYCDAKGK